MTTGRGGSDILPRNRAKEEWNHRGTVAVTLTITAGPEQGRSLECDRELVIGRGDVDVVLSDEEVSSRHAVVRPVKQGLEIEDLGSKNGTFVNGERISGPTMITATGALKLGATQLAVEVPATTNDTRSPEVRARQEAITSVRKVPPADSPAEQPAAGVLMKTPVGRFLRRRRMARAARQEPPRTVPSDESDGG
jgi:hypothetical protein